MTVYKDEKTNTWYCQFYYKDWDGKRKHTTKRGFERKRDAQKYEYDFKNSIKLKQITLETLIHKYLENINQRIKLGTLKPTTIERYESIINLYIKPYFNLEMLIEDMTTDMINNWLVKLKEEVRTLRKKPLKISTVTTAKIQLGSILKFAVRKKYLASTPMLDAEKLPPVDRKPQVVWTMEEYLKFYNTLKKEYHKVAFNIMFFCGLRIGEVLALTPSDINADGTISIRHTLGVVKKKKVTLSPKTRYSVRKISTPKFVFDQLVNYVNHLYDCQPDEKIFKCGRRNLALILDYHLKALDLERLTPHGLRHSNASILLKLTGDIAMVSHRLGHKNPNITLQVYSHMLPGSDTEAIELLNNLAINKHQGETIDVEAEKLPKLNSSQK